jgi:hypothetical protein
MQPGGCACYYFKGSRDEPGLVKKSRPQNGSTSVVGEKRAPLGSVRSNQIVRRIAKQPRSIRVCGCAPLHRNIRIERTQAPRRKARKWATFHISGSRPSFFLMGERTTQLWPIS